MTTSNYEQVFQEIATLSEEAGYAASDQIDGFVGLELMESLV